MKPTAEQVFFVLLAIAVFSNLASKKEGFNVGESMRDIGRDVGGGISGVGDAIGEGVADVGALVGQGAGALGLGYAGGNPDSWAGGSIRPPMDIPRDDGWEGDDRWRRRRHWRRQGERKWREDHDDDNDRWNPGRSSNYVDSWRHHDWASSCRSLASAGSWQRCGRNCKRKPRWDGWNSSPNRPAKMARSNACINCRTANLSNRS